MLLLPEVSARGLPSLRGEIMAVVIVSLSFLLFSTFCTLASLALGGGSSSAPEHSAALLWSHHGRLSSPETPGGGWAVRGGRPSCSSPSPRALLDQEFPSPLCTREKSFLSSGLSAPNREAGQSKIATATSSQPLLSCVHAGGEGTLGNKAPLSSASFSGPPLLERSHCSSRAQARSPASSSSCFYRAQAEHSPRLSASTVSPSSPCCFLVQPPRRFLEERSSRMLCLSTHPGTDQNSRGRRWFHADERGKDKAEGPSLPFSLSGVHGTALEMIHSSSHQHFPILFPRIHDAQGSRLSLANPSSCSSSSSFLSPSPSSSSGRLYAAFSFLGPHGRSAKGGKASSASGGRTDGQEAADQRTKIDLYELVGVLPSASKTEIEERFLETKKQFEDLGGGDASLLRMLEAARRILTDDQLRSSYDETGSIPAAYSQSFSFFRQTSPGALRTDGEREDSKFSGSREKEERYRHHIASSGTGSRGEGGGAGDWRERSGDGEEGVGSFDEEKRVEGDSEKSGEESEDEREGEEEEESGVSSSSSSGGARRKGGLMEVFSSFFGSGLEGSRRRRRNGTRGRSKADDVWADVTVGLKESAVRDVEKTVRIDALRRCSHCQGSGGEHGEKAKPCKTCKGQGALVKVQRTSMGVIRASSTCPTCGGSGEQERLLCSRCSGSGRRREEDATLRVRLPAGVADGMTLRIRGQGDVGLDESQDPGDLVLKVQVENDTPFRREGNNLLGIVRVSYLDAILGVKDKEVDVIDGVARISIPPGVQSGEKILIKGRGTIDAVGSSVDDDDDGDEDTRQERRGDHIVVIEVEIPKEVSPEERRLLDQLRELNTRRKSRS